MTNEQFYVLIGIPALGILINGIVAQMLSARIATVETRMLNIENTFTTRFDMLMGRLSDLEKEIHHGR